MLLMPDAMWLLGTMGMRHIIISWLYYPIPLANYLGMCCFRMFPLKLQDAFLPTEEVSGDNSITFMPL